MSWKRFVWVYHRDVGYFLTGLVIIYSVSGIAVNHVADWNPSFTSQTTPVSVGPLPGDDLDTLERGLVERLKLDPAEVKGRHRPAPDTFTVFLPNGGEAKVSLATGEGAIKRVWTRTGIFETNVLHLNHIKGLWTVVADLFCVLLIGLAVTGLFILKGKEGFGGRGKWLVAAGTLLPVVFIVFYYLLRK